MRFFPLIDLQHLLLGFFLGLAAALIIFLAFRYTGRTGSAASGSRQVDETGETYPEGLRIGNNPVPPVLIFVFLGFVVWLIFYAVIFGIFGGPV